MLTTLALTLPRDSLTRRAVDWLFGVLVQDARDFHQHMRVLHEYTTEVIKNRNHSDTTSKDILGLFIKASQDQEHPMSHKYLSDVVLNLIIAGRDTTACLLSWTFYVLAKNPSVLAKLREELESVECDDYGIMKHQPYLTGLLYEVARLYPSVPSDGKTAYEDDVLPDGTVVHRDAMVAYFPYAMGRDPDLWPEPEQVRPERWLQDGKLRAPNQYDFPVFQAGPRICLGMNFALLEASVATAKLVQQFNFHLISHEELIPDTGKITMCIKGPLMMQFEPL